MANILVVEDEVMVLDLIASTLRLDGHSVAGLTNPLAALDVSACERSIDLLLTDIEMRPISGFELVKRLSKMGLTSPVLFMSGYPALAGAVANSLGRTWIIQKPFTAGQLRAAVRSAFTNHEGDFPFAA